MDLVHIEEVAHRHDVPLFRTSRSGQFKARCPVCQDHRRQFHLSVSADRDSFYCHKCGAHGGVIAFHAWLHDISFERAKADLYPTTWSSRKGTPGNLHTHPADQLTRGQLQELGLTLRTPGRFPPAGFAHEAWAKRRQAELDWIWSLWRGYMRRTRQTQRNLLRAGLQSGWAYKPLLLARARRVVLGRSIHRTGRKRAK